MNKINNLKLKGTIVSLILKLIAIISVIVGVILSYKNNSSEFMSGSVVFMYFTIQSNIAIALIALIGGLFLVLNKKVSYVWYVIKLVGTVSITLTGMVFTFVLAPTLGNMAWSIANVLTHVVVPLVAIVDLFITCKEIKYRKVDLIYNIVPPLLYAIYAGIGYSLNWKFSTNTNYPYFFLNWGSEAGGFGFSSSLPFMGVVYWIILLLAFLVGVGFLYRFLLILLNKKCKGE